MGRLGEVETSQELLDCLASKQHTWPKKHAPGRRAAEQAHAKTNDGPWLEFILDFAQERFHAPDDETDFIEEQLGKKKKEKHEEWREEQQKDPDANSESWLFCVWWVGGVRGTATSRGLMVEKYQSTLQTKRAKKYKPAPVGTQKIKRDYEKMAGEQHEDGFGDGIGFGDLNDSASIDIDDRDEFLQGLQIEDAEGDLLADEAIGGAGAGAGPASHLLNNYTNPKYVDMDVEMGDASGGARVLAEGFTLDDQDRKARTHRSRMWASHADKIYRKAMISRNRLQMLKLFRLSLSIIMSSMPGAVMVNLNDEEQDDEDPGHGDPVASDPGQDPDLINSPRVAVRLCPDGTDYRDKKVTNARYSVYKCDLDQPRRLARVAGIFPLTPTAGGATNFMSDLHEASLKVGLPLPDTWNATTTLHGKPAAGRPSLTLITDSGSDVVRMAKIWRLFVTSHVVAKIAFANAAARQADPLQEEPGWTFSRMPCLLHLTRLICKMVLTHFTEMRGLPMVRTLTAVSKAISWHFTKRGEKEGVVEELGIRKVRAFASCRRGGGKDNRKLYLRACQCLESKSWRLAVSSLQVVLGVVNSISTGVMAASRMTSNSLTSILRKLPNPSGPDLLAKKLKATHAQLHQAEEHATTAQGWGAISLACHAVVGALKLRETPTREHPIYNMKNLANAHADEELAKKAAKYLRQRQAANRLDPFSKDILEKIPGEIKQLAEGRRALPSKAFVRETAPNAATHVCSSQDAESTHSSTQYVKHEGGASLAVATADIRTFARTDWGAPWTEFKSLHNDIWSRAASRKGMKSLGQYIGNPLVENVDVVALMNSFYAYADRADLPDGRFADIFPRGDVGVRGAAAFEGDREPLDMQRLRLRPSDLLLINGAAHVVVTATESGAVLVEAKENGASLAEMKQGKFAGAVHINTKYPATGHGVATLSKVVREAWKPIPLPNKYRKVEQQQAQNAASSSSSSSSGAAKAKSSAAAAKALPKAIAKASGPSAAQAAQALLDEARTGIPAPAHLQPELPPDADPADYLGIILHVCHMMQERSHWHWVSQQMRGRVLKADSWDSHAWTKSQMVKPPRRAAANVHASPSPAEYASCGIPKTTAVLYAQYSTDTKMWNISRLKGWKPGPVGVQVQSNRLRTCKKFGRRDRVAVMKVACEYFCMPFKAAPETALKKADKLWKQYISDNMKKKAEKDLGMESESEPEEAEDGFAIGLELVF
eukprot:g17686.t1